MSYPLALDKPQEITVDARVNGQQIIERFHFRSTEPGNPFTDGSSAQFLGFFRTIYRTNILSFHYEDFVVQRYWMREVDGAFMYAAAVPPAPGIPGQPSRWRTEYNPEGLDILEGIAADKGALAIAASKMLPMHTVMRCKKVPIIHRIGYFKGGYTRFGGFGVGDKDAIREEWAIATLNTVQTALDNMWNSNIPAGGVQFWKMAIWSPDYYGRVVKPRGGNASEASPVLQAWIPLKTIGTQLTRLYKPNNLKRGS